jgi:hypothetical protein
MKRCILILFILVAVGATSFAQLTFDEMVICLGPEGKLKIDENLKDYLEFKICNLHEANNVKLIGVEFGFKRTYKNGLVIGRLKVNVSHNQSKIIKFYPGPFVQEYEYKYVCGHKYIYSDGTFGNMVH